MRTASFVLAYLISCQLACKPQAEDKSADTRNASKRRDTPATPFLTGSDVKPGKLLTLSADEVRAIIHRNPVFYAQEDSGGQKKDAFGRCVDDLLNNGSIKAKGETLTFSYEFDASSCISKLGNPEGFEGSVRYKYFTMMLCKDADVSFLDGKNRADMKANSSKLDKVCESSSTQAILLNIQMDFELSGTIESDGVTYEYHTKRRNISARYSSPMQPCKSRKNFEGNWEHEDGCVALSRSITLQALRPQVMQKRNWRMPCERFPRERKLRIGANDRKCLERASPIWRMNGITARFLPSFACRGSVKT